ncbi:MAG: ribose-phosphate pyrophosphokinase [Acidobacteria bacterium]|uniref:Ribose-phosphate pyrophosphokinase n=1 Tax=Candidatus Polarisedimenticola svalbardensis TaxID=2886004 RepID=A0A8J6Y3Q8_9BACT|nr:ribose-phosphate pyrophosphokinase [Candidatus Polarisedimenticola svalbardensis]
MKSELKVFSGNGNPKLADAICEYLRLPMGNWTLRRFSDGEIYCHIKENVRGTDVFIIQPTCSPANENLMELLVAADAFKRASADRVTAVIPYYGYARQDRKDQPRVPITAKLVADLITAAGFHRILTMDLHAPAIQGFFDVPVDHLFAAPVVLDWLEQQEYQNITVVSPDAGGVERARFHAKRLGAELAIIDKRRVEANVAETMNVIGDVDGRTCIIVDDIIDTGGTMMGSVRALKEKGAVSVVACFTHAVLSGPAMERLSKMDLDRVVVTDTIPLSPEKLAYPKITVLPVAGLLGEAIARIHSNSSVSSLFVQ